jgi:hypothetical protein
LTGGAPDIAGEAKSANIRSYWGVEDIEPAVAHFIEQGAAWETKPADVGGEITVATVEAPWGNAIGLIYNPEFGVE